MICLSAVLTQYSAQLHFARGVVCCTCTYNITEFSKMCVYVLVHYTYVVFALCTCTRRTPTHVRSLNYDTVIIYCLTIINYTSRYWRVRLSRPALASFVGRKGHVNLYDRDFFLSGCTSIPLRCSTIIIYQLYNSHYLKKNKVYLNSTTYIIYKFVSTYFIFKQSKCNNNM